jgi:hypothetical protein
MPSDDRVQLASRALQAPRDAFQAILVATVEQVDDFLARSRASGNGRGEQLAAELGPFARGRIDVERLVPLFQDRAKFDALTIETVQRARDTLLEIAKRNHRLFTVDVPSTRDIREYVAEALAEIGRAFGATRIFELTRSGSYHGNEHARSLGSFPFAKWSKGERRLAPPLTVMVDGADLRAESLAEFLDGSQKIVLIVRGACAPAPLVRLITPGTFALQTVDGAGLDRFAAYEGPGVAVLVPESAARFIHDPLAGAEPWDRLTVGFLPEKEPRGSIGGVSGAQQAEELRQLKALTRKSEAPAPAAAGSGMPVAAAGPADKLAAWLLSQADLSDLG